MKVPSCGITGLNRAMKVFLPWALIKNNNNFLHDIHEENYFAEIREFSRGSVCQK